MYFQYRLAKDTGESHYPKTVNPGTASPVPGEDYSSSSYAVRPPPLLQHFRVDALIGPKWTHILPHIWMETRLKSTSLICGKCSRFPAANLRVNPGLRFGEITQISDI
ncbi:hypothetical protein JTB14_033035 [Gonioctena quinquepunctata]|nr:hypothetical protein JTB14_033035 [Gonioctena quinquepunctata]